MSYAANWPANTDPSSGGRLPGAIRRLLRDALLERQALPDGLRSVLPVVLRIAVQRVLHLLR